MFAYRILSTCLIEVWKANVISLLFQVRREVDEKHSLWYGEAVKFADKIGVKPAVPRIVQRQSLRNNVPAPNPEIYYRRALTVPLLDHIITEIDGRLVS